ncbi:holo-ACP synthase [Clostridium sp. KNHs214]|uniref:holo-ACP synthase n=1 Tax=Clostridium sp. KNHs214 TaxID=1540257 RepID=UPI000554535E|nr:holo-ACP synthase [Clostridium sp. KNHs214]
MIAGIGIDIVEISRIERILKDNSLFLYKIFNEEEIIYLKNRNLRYEYVAGRFAAKEAVSKALGTGFTGFSFKDIIIKNTELGKPIVELKKPAKEIAEKQGKYKMHLSISHSRENAIAYAVWEVDNFEDRHI